MKKLLVLAALLAFSAHSDTELKELTKKVNCGPAKAVLTDLMLGDYKEKLFWMGDDSDTKYALLVNGHGKTTWTFIQYDDTMACILGSGNNAKQIFTGPHI